MSSFGSSGSKWSGERAREERERQREAQKELLRQARLEREAKDAQDAEEKEAAARATPVPDPAPGRRRLSEEERAEIRRSRGLGPEADDDPEPVPSAPVPSARASVGRKWRSSVEESGTVSALPALPDLPGDQGGARGSGSGFSTRLIVFGAVLFGAMAIFFFLPFGPFGGGGSDITPTPTEDVPVIGDLGTLPPINGTPQVRPTAPSDNQRVVCIDPGHGGWDYGYQRTWDDMTQRGPTLNESEINLGMAYMLKERLESEGITVVMTRAGGEAVNTFGEDANGDGKTIFDGSSDEDRKRNGDWDEIQRRINICNDAKADILISVHINGARELPDARGYEVYYTAAPIRPFGELSHQLADLVYRQMFDSLEDNGYSGGGRGAKDDSQLEAEKYAYGAQDHLLLTGPAVDTPDRKLVPSAMPGVIVEPIFLSNEEDANFISQPQSQLLLVNAYAEGILDYFAANPG